MDSQPLFEWALSQFPNLFRETIWPNGPTRVQFARRTRPPDHLVSNVNAVPITLDGLFVVIELADGTWEIPGGTIEPSERPIEALARELIEEAGAHLESATYLGAWEMTSLAENPFRPHLPHPISYRSVYRCNVSLASEPQIPEEGGEKIISVQVMSLSEASACFEGAGRDDLAELYQFAASPIANLG